MRLGPVTDLVLIGFTVALILGWALGRMLR